MVEILDNINIKTTIYLKPCEITHNFTYHTKNTALKVQKVNQVNTTEGNHKTVTTYLEEVKNLLFVIYLFSGCTVFSEE